MTTITLYPHFHTQSVNKKKESFWRLAITNYGYSCAFTAHLLTCVLPKDDLFRRFEIGYGSSALTVTRCSGRLVAGLLVEPVFDATRRIPGYKGVPVQYLEKGVPVQ